MLTKTMKAVRKDQNNDRGMEDCWELSEGRSLCIRLLSWIRRSKGLSLLESMEKFLLILQSGTCLHLRNFYHYHKFFLLVSLIFPSVFNIQIYS